MNVKKLSILALFIALSVIGAFIKVPAIIGSVALDAFPALLAGAFLGGVPGAIVGGLGHLLSALLGGMPLGPLHFLIAIEMALLVWLFAVIYRKGSKLTASSLFIIGNGFILPLPFILFFDWAFYVALVPSLFVGALLNAVLGVLLIPRLAPIFANQFIRKEVKD